MRKAFWFLLALIVIGSAPTAKADSFAPTFTCSCGPTTPVASAVAFPSPTLDVTILGSDFSGFPVTVTLLSSSLPGDSYTWSTTREPSNSTEGFMTIDDITQGTSVVSSVGFGPSFFPTESGTLTFTAVIAPEPSSVALMLLGAGLVFVMRKRGHQLAS